MRPINISLTYPSPRVRFLPLVPMPQSPMGIDINLSQPNVRAFSPKIHVFLTRLPSKVTLTPGPYSISVMKHCIPIVYRRPSTVSEYPKSILPLIINHIDTFFSENRLSILDFNAHDVH